MALRALPVVSFCFLLLSLGYLRGGLELPLGSADRPGAGVYPLLVGILLVVLSFSLFLQSLRGRAARDREEPFPRGADLKRVAAIGSVLALFVILLKPLGYAPTSFLLMAATLRLLGQKSWIRIIFVSAACAILSHFLFARLLGVPLPPGILFD